MKKIFWQKLLFLLVLIVVFQVNSTVSQTAAGDLHYVSSQVMSPFTIEPIDIDKDGDIDIISGSSTDSIIWFKNDGNGTFNSSELISTELDNVRWIFGCDLDKDGDNDIVTASKNDNTLAWLSNDGNENFGNPIIIANDANIARYVGAYDMDNDGDIDIVSSYQYKTVWYENDGNCEFGEPHTISSNWSYRLCIADIDGDSFNDIFSLNYTQEGLIWYKNNGDKTFTQKIAELPTSHDNCYDVYVEDVDGDGLNDLIASLLVDDYYGKIAWFRNEGNGILTYYNKISLKYEEFQRITAGDFDADGDADVFAPRSYDNILYWYENDDLSFDSEEIASNMAEYIDIDMTDMDNDNDLDVVVSSSNRSKIVWIENLSMEVLSQPEDKNICAFENTTFSILFKDATSVKWLMKESNESNFSYVEENETFQGVLTQELSIIEPDPTMDGYQFCCVGNNGSWPLFSDTVTLSIVEDIEPPVLIVKDAELFLSEYINTELKISDVIDTVYDNCMYVETLFSNEVFDCSLLGMNEVEVTATDGWGNSISKTVNLMVRDTISPVIEGYTEKIEFFTAASTYRIQNDECDPVLYYDNCMLSEITNDHSATSSLQDIEIPLGSTTVEWEAIDQSGNSAYWSIDLLVTNTNDYTVFPNPFEENIYIEQKILGEYNLKVFDLSGKLISQINGINEIQYNLAPVSLKRGSYIIHIDNGIQTKDIKVIKAK